MRSVTREQFWELMANAYRDIAYEAHMNRFAPMKGSFWAKSVKERYRIIDGYATEIARKKTDNGMFCTCGHPDTSHMFDGQPAAQCIGNWNMCKCKKFMSKD
jgi:hypothetical protein